MRVGDLVAAKYRLKRVLGEGAMGQVWEALNEGTHGEVALKLIPNPNAELRARMLREARACGSLRHPNIVEIYDVGETQNGDPFLVMQLLSGETLADRLAREGRLPAVRAAAIAYAIARALRAAHAKGIIHRDLKPANIFLHREADADGEQIKVLDFGVSKNLAGDATSTATGMLVGSPAYMSPEQANGDKQIDPRSDLWSLGVVTFEMLAGRRPFPSSSPYVAIAEVIGAPIPRLSEVMPGVSPGLSSIVGRCLTRDPAARAASAAELVALLRPHTDDMVATGDGMLRMSFVPEAPPSAPALQIAREGSLPQTEVLKVGTYEVPPALLEDKVVEGPRHPPAPPGDLQSEDDERPTTQPEPLPMPPASAKTDLVADVPVIALAVPLAPRFGAPPLGPLAPSDVTLPLPSALSTADDLRRTEQIGRSIVVPGATASSSTTPLTRPPVPAPARGSSFLPRSRAPALVLVGVSVAALLSVGLMLSRRFSTPSPEASVRGSSAAESATPAPAPEPQIPPVPAPGPTGTSAPVAEPAPEPSASAAPTAEPQPASKRTWLTIRANVGAIVFLDGHQIGITPLVPIVVAPGPHKVLFKYGAPGERLVREQVVHMQAKAGEINYVTVSFAPKAPTGKAMPGGI
jgi:serine/threonine-protein kinase